MECLGSLITADGSSHAGVDARIEAAWCMYWRVRHGSGCRRDAGPTRRGSSQRRAFVVDGIDGIAGVTEPCMENGAYREAARTAAATAAAAIAAIIATAA